MSLNTMQLGYIKIVDYVTVEFFIHTGIILALKFKGIVTWQGGLNP